MGSFYGRHARNLTSVPNGRLVVQHSTDNCKGKSRLTDPHNKDDDAKAGPNEPTSLISEGGDNRKVTLGIIELSPARAYIDLGLATSMSSLPILLVNLGGVVRPLKGMRWV